MVQEYAHVAGAYMKVRVLLEGQNDDSVLKPAVEELKGNGDLTVDLGLSAVKILVKFGRFEIFYTVWVAMLRKQENEFKSVLLCLQETVGSPAAQQHE